MFRFWEVVSAVFIRWPTLTVAVGLVFAILPATARADIAFTGSVTPTPPIWNSDTDGIIGYDAPGSVTISNGDALNDRNLYIAYLAAVSSGTLTVTDAGSQMNNSAAVYVGYGGSTSALVTIANGGAMNNAAANIAYGTGSSGSVTVDGAASTWYSTGPVTLGSPASGAHGYLNITNGATVTSAGGYIGMGTILGVSTGSVTVDASTWNVPSGAGIMVGYGSGPTANNGTGYLNIYNGGTVTCSNAGLATGNGPAPNPGTVNVDGSASVWTIIGNLTIGAKGSSPKGILNISGGGSITVFGSTVVGSLQSTAGQINFLGSGGTLSTRDFTAAFSQVTGSTGTINTHGIISDVGLTFDGSHGARQRIATLGSGVGLWLDVGDSSLRGDLGLGVSGSGSLTIAQGVAVYCNNGYLGFGSGSRGTAVVADPNSTWNCSSLTVGRNGGGTLTIRNGGSVSSAAGCIASTSGSAGTVTVDGAGSTWQSTGTVTLAGGGGNGMLTISNGGALVANSVTGGAAGGTMTVNFAGGTLRAYNANSAKWLTAGSTSSSNVSIQSGGATLDTNGCNMTIDAALQHSGTGVDGGITKKGGGTLVLTGANTYTGPTRVLPESPDIIIPPYPDYVSARLVFDYGGAYSDAAFLSMVVGVLNTAQLSSGPFNPPLLRLQNTTTHQMTVVGTLFGDANLDGTVNGMDLNITLSNSGRNVPFGLSGWLMGDFNGDGKVDGTDAAIVMGYAGRSLNLTGPALELGPNAFAPVFTGGGALVGGPHLWLPGDANLDGTVNGADLNIVLSNYNSSGMSWRDGDFGGDGTVNGTDLNTVLSNYNQSVGVGAAVPEPFTLILLAVGAVGLFGCAWRRRSTIAETP